MSLVLERSESDLREAFALVATRRDLAALLEVDYAHLDYHIRRFPQERRYRSFKIPKKNGTPRVIHVPATALMIIQRKLNQVLQASFARKASVYGFVRNKSIVENAKQHVGRRWVLNVDLSDFFPSISFHDVRAAFENPPYNRPRPVALALAQICCHHGTLPQGAPTSPIVSNIVCAKLDSKLRKLANGNKCVYTRYADDITISTNLARFPSGLATTKQGHLEVGRDLANRISWSGFFINPNKVRLRGRDQRQEVTGLVVNGSHPRVPRESVRGLRALLHNWRTNGYRATEDNLAGRYYGLREYRSTGVPSLHAYVRGKLEFLGMVNGRADANYRRLSEDYRDLVKRDADCV